MFNPIWDETVLPACVLPRKLEKLRLDPDRPTAATPERCKSRRDRRRPPSEKRNPGGGGRGFQDGTTNWGNSVVSEHEMGWIGDRSILMMGDLIAPM
jgi:hypothetical protein